MRRRDLGPDLEGSGKRTIQPTTVPTRRKLRTMGICGGCRTSVQWVEVGTGGQALSDCRIWKPSGAQTNNATDDGTIATVSEGGLDGCKER